MKKIILFALAIFALQVESFACTSAIVTAQRSSEGVPLLWKHRDWRVANSFVKHIEGGKYAYTAIVSSARNSKSVYAGINDSGFGIINTATSNLPKSSEEEHKACERKQIATTTLWHRALRSCATVDEFEEILRTTKRRNKFNTNIAVADATGAVAYFEIWDLDYRRYDATERAEGFDVRANFSFAGNEKKRGASIRRYDIIKQEMSSHEGVFAPQDFLRYSRSYNSCKYGDILANNDEYICNNYTVPRATTTGVFVLVCDAKCPRMLVEIGHSVSGVAVPVYVQAKHQIPQCVGGKAMENLSKEFMSKAYHKVEKKNVLQKELVRNVLKIKQPKVLMPKEMPADIIAFNTKIDKAFAKHAKKVRKVLSKY